MAVMSIVSCARLLAKASLLGIVGLFAARSASATPGAAADGQSRIYALQFLQATHSREKLETAAKAMADPMVNSIKQAHPEASNAVLQKFRQSFMRRMAGVNARLEALQAAVLVRHYSAQELKEMAAFYGSPTGQHFQRESRLTMGEIAPSRQKWINEAATAAARDTLGSATVKRP